MRACIKNILTAVNTEIYLALTEQLIIVTTEFGGKTTSCRFLIGQVETIGMECVVAVSSLLVGRKPRTREQAA